MKLQTKLIVTVLLTVLISLFLIERITFSNAERTLEVRVIQDLDSTAQALESFIEQVLEEQKSQLEIIATYEELTLEELIEIQDLQEEVWVNQINLVFVREPLTWSKLVQEIKERLW